MKPKLERNITLLYVFSFLRWFAFWVPIEQLFLYSIGGNEAVLGIGAAIWTASVFLFEIPSGYISDKFGKKKVFYIAMISRILAFMVIAIPQTVPSYYLGWFLFGIAMAFVSGSDKALLHDTLAELKREGEYRKLSGRINGLSILGVTLSGFMALAVSSQLGYPASFLLSAIPQLAILVIVFLMLEPKQHDRELLKNPLKDMLTALRAISATSALQLLLLLAGTMSLVSRLAIDYSQALFFTLLGSASLVSLVWVLGAASRSVSNFFAHKIEASTWPLAAATFAALIAIAFGPGWLAPYLYIAVFLPISVVILQAEEAVQKVAPSHLRATVLSGMNMFLNLISALPIVLVGWFMSRQGPVAGFRVFSATLGLVMFVVYVLIRARKRLIPKEVL